METIKIKSPRNIEINFIDFQKMNFIYNAIKNGWEVKINEDKYIFSKKHEGKKEVFHENYLKRFIEKNLNFSDLIN